MRIVSLLLITVLLTACGDKNEHPIDSDTESAAMSKEDEGMDEAAIEYQKKVQKRVSSAVTASLAREWDVSEEQVKCVMGQLKFSEIQQANTDPAARAVFDECGVDPAVVK